ncbi:MAG: efflux RND transporter periplasmic adaptor subunit [Planctomycetia bacterium]|nr:efflux RND transporter periplasmic adaptor subunit [Planctomycetia bacterium]
MLFRRACPVLLLAVAVGVVGCRGAKTAPPTPPPPKVTVFQPVTAPVRDYWHYNGYLEATESVEVRARVHGYLTAIEFREGTEVEKNAPLYKIDQREYDTARKKAKADLDKAKAEVKKAKADVLNWKAQIKLANAELARVNLAVSSGAAGRADQDKAKAALEVAQAELASAEAQQSASDANVDAAEQNLRTMELQLAHTDIRAMIGGRIGRTLVHVGNLVGQDGPTLLTTIVRVDEIFIYFDAPEGDLTAFQRSLMTTPGPEPTSRQIPVEIGVAGEDGYPHVGRIDFRENRVDTASGTVRIRGRIPNPLRNNIRLLYPGLYARVRVPRSEPRPQTVVPEDCLLTGQEGRFTYVVNTDGKVEKRIVTVGAVVWKAPPMAPGVAPPSWVLVNPKPTSPPEGQPPAPTRKMVKSVVAITVGLQPTDRVILDGLHQIKPGIPVTPEEWNMLPPVGAPAQK